MKRIDELYVEKATRILALGLFGRIALEAFKLAHESPNSELGLLFKEMSAKLPEHYLAGRKVNLPEYKVVSFVDSQSLISMISEAEAFLQECLVEVICRHPAKIGKETMELKKLAELGTVEAAVRFAAMKYVHEVMYGKPNDYKKEIAKTFSMSEQFLDDLWPIYVEAKARRDLGVHNSWKVNDIYRGKIKEVGLADTGLEELSVDVNYFLKVRETVIALMERVRKHCETKFS